MKVSASNHGIGKRPDINVSYNETRHTVLLTEIEVISAGKMLSDSDRDATFNDKHWCYGRS